MTDRMDARLLRRDDLSCWDRVPLDLSASGSSYIHIKYMDLDKKE